MHAFISAFDCLLLTRSLQQQLEPWVAPPPGSPTVQEILIHGGVQLRLTDATKIHLRPRDAAASGALTRDAVRCLARARAALLGRAEGGAAGDGGEEGGDAGGGGGGGGDGAGSEGDGGLPWDEWNRLALPGSLHRIAGAFAGGGGRKRLLGLTYRVGRHVPGAAAPLRDLLAHMVRVHRGRAPGRCFGGGARDGSAIAAAAGGGAPADADEGGGRGGSPSLLLRGKPGTGKTTLLRCAPAAAGSNARAVVIAACTDWHSQNETMSTNHVPLFAL